MDDTFGLLTKMYSEFSIFSGGNFIIVKNAAPLGSFVPSLTSHKDKPSTKKENWQGL